jgi:hypothetical protein
MSSLKKIYLTEIGKQLMRLEKECNITIVDIKNNYNRKEWILSCYNNHKTLLFVISNYEGSLSIKLGNSLDKNGNLNYSVIDLVKPSEYVPINQLFNFLKTFLEIV